MRTEKILWLIIAGGIFAANLSWASYGWAQDQNSVGENWSQSVTELRSSIDEIIAENNALREDIKNLSQKKRDLKSELEKLNFEKGQFSQEPARLKKSLEEKTEEEARLSEELAGLRDKYDRLQQEQDDAELRIVANEGEAQSLQIEISNLRKEIGDLEVRNKRLKNENKKSISALRREVERSHRRLEELKVQQARLQKEYQLAEDRLSEPRRQKESLSRERQRLEDHLAQLKGQSDDVDTDQQKEDEKYQASLDEQNQKIRELDDEINKLLSTQRELEQTLADVRRRSLGGQAAGYQKEEGALKANLAMLKKENASLENEVQTLTGIIDDLNRQRMTIETLLENAEKK